MRATGYEIGFFIFYLVPVSIAAWFAGRRPGLAVAAGVCWYLSDRLSHHPYSRAALIYRETLHREPGNRDPRGVREGHAADARRGDQELQAAAGRLQDEGQAMNRAQKERFERAGWKLGTASELLGLTEAEEALVEAKLKARTLRLRRHLSQAALAKLIGSSQPRVAKLENRDPEVSLDLQMKAIFAANPGARRDFQGLIKKWGTGQRGRPVAVGAGARGQR